MTLERSGPLSRYTRLGRGKAINRVGKKRKRELEARRDVRMQVFTRDRFECQMPRYIEAHFASKMPNPVSRALAALAGECFGRLQMHELRKASQASNTYTVENGVALCAHHNTWVEDHPDAAHLLGLVIRRGDHQPQRRTTP